LHKYSDNYQQLLRNWFVYFLVAKFFEENNRLKYSTLISLQLVNNESSRVAIKNTNLGAAVAIHQLH
ncbi:14547_t:CDS:1, partial [Racocetra persica]